MRKENVKTPEEALAYLADCTLATIEEILCYKNVNKTQLERHISIAETNMQFCHMFNCNVTGTRASDIEPFGKKYKTVLEWGNAEVRSKIQPDDLIVLKDKH